jgi:hypothetical protein
MLSEVQIVFLRSREKRGGREMKTGIWINHKGKKIAVNIHGEQYDPLRGILYSVSKTTAESGHGLFLVQKNKIKEVKDHE